MMELNRSEEFARANRVNLSRSGVMNVSGPVSGPCLSGSISQTATPWLYQHYPVSLLLWVAPTSATPRLRSRWLDSFEGATGNTDGGDVDLPRCRDILIYGSKCAQTPGRLHVLANNARAVVACAQ